VADESTCSSTSAQVMSRSRDIRWTIRWARSSRSGPGPRGLRKQHPVGRVEQVGQHVDADPTQLAGDLGTGYQGQAESPGGLGGGRPARGAVVVGQRDDVQPGCRGGLDHLSRRIGSVRRGGMQVEVDEHQVSVGVG